MARNKLAWIQVLSTGRLKTTRADIAGNVCQALSYKDRAGITQYRKPAARRLSADELDALLPVEKELRRVEKAVSGAKRDRYVDARKEAASHFMTPEEYIKKAPMIMEQADGEGVVEDIEKRIDYLRVGMSEIDPGMKKVASLKEALRQTAVLYVANLTAKEEQAEVDEVKRHRRIEFEAELEYKAMVDKEADSDVGNSETEGTGGEVVPQASESKPSVEKSPDAQKPTDSQKPAAGTKGSAGDVASAPKTGQGEPRRDSKPQTAEATQGV